MMGGRIRNIEYPLLKVRIHGTNMSRDKALRQVEWHARKIRQYNKDAGLVFNTELKPRKRDFGNPAIDMGPISALALANLPYFKSEMKIRILVFLPWLDKSGATKVFTKIAEKLQPLGFDFIIILTENHPDDASRLEIGFECWTLPELLDVDLWQAFVKYLVESRNIRVVWQLGSSWLYENIDILSNYSLRTVDSLFSPASTHLDKSISCGRAIDNVVFESSLVESVYRKKGGNAESNLAPNGVEFFDVNLDEQKTIDLLYVGRMSIEKGPLEFVDMIQILTQLKPKNDFNILMIGGGPLLETVKSAVASRNLPIKVVGHQPDPINFMKMAKITVVTSTPVDGRPNVVLESMSVGTPVVAYSVGDLPNVIDHGLDGCLINYASKDQMAISCISILNDESILRSLSANALNNARQKHTWHKAYNTYESIFRILDSPLNDLQ
jgi:O-antigen biosynthesis protein